jgi:hypothetical protein
LSEENVSLIREINDLRREINALKHERQAQDQVEKRFQLASLKRENTDKY